MLKINPASNNTGRVINVDARDLSCDIFSNKGQGSKSLNYALLAELYIKINNMTC